MSSNCPLKPKYLQSRKVHMKYLIRFYFLFQTSVVPSLDYYIQQSSVTSTDIFIDQLNSSTVEVSKRLVDIFYKRPMFDHQLIV